MDPVLNNASIEKDIYGLPPPDITNNITTMTAVFDDGEGFSDCLDTLIAVFTYVELPIATVGVIGNIMSAIVFSMDKKKYSSHTLLITLAIVDSFLLLSNEMVQILEWYMNPERNCIVRFIVLRILHPMVHTLHATNIWLTLLIAINRFIAICRPFSVSYWCTKKKTYLLLVLLIITAIIYNIPRFFEYSVKKSEQGPPNGPTQVVCELKERPLHHSLVYNGLMYFTFITIGPMIIIVCLYCKIIQDLKQQTAKCKMGKRQDVPSALRTTEERQATNSILAIITVFIIVQTLVTISRLMQTFSVVSCGPARYFHVTVDLLVVFNSSVNFVLYCAIRKTFRRRLKNLFCDGKTASNSESDPYEA